MFCDPVIVWRHLQQIGASPPVNILRAMMLRCSVRLMDGSGRFAVFAVR